MVVYVDEDVVDVVVYVDEDVVVYVDEVVEDVEDVEVVEDVEDEDVGVVAQPNAVHHHIVDVGVAHAGVA